jgi:membrane protein YdbS with pleckstrin-like domain
MEGLGVEKNYAKSLFLFLKGIAIEISTKIPISKTWVSIGLLIAIIILFIIAISLIDTSIRIRKWRYMHE